MPKIRKSLSLSRPEMSTVLGHVHSRKFLGINERTLALQVLILGSYPNADLAPFVQRMAEEHPRLTVRYLQVGFKLKVFPEKSVDENWPLRSTRRWAPPAASTTSATASSPATPTPSSS